VGPSTTSPLSSCIGACDLLLAWTSFANTAVQTAHLKDQPFVECAPIDELLKAIGRVFKFFGMGKIKRSVVLQLIVRLCLQEFQRESTAGCCGPDFCLIFASFDRATMNQKSSCRPFVSSALMADKSTGKAVRTIAAAA
jgi:hypothetical protein